ncbi:MAG: DUF1554 domain-containing protein [Leptospiraceae bacterium]|nr:DUF1554 domain-containing protein [Leptospiraceae bacterium]
MRLGVYIGLALSFAACNSYNLLDTLEKPGAARGGAGGDGGSGGDGGGAPTSCGSTCRIFVSQTAVPGNFGGPAQADTICMNDANRPPGNRIWKAMLVDGTTRKACNSPTCGGNPAEHLNWVLRPYTQYVRVDGLPIQATVSAGIFNFVGDLTNPISADYLEVWTGLQNDWVSASSGATCQNWSSSSGFELGSYGKANQTSNEAIRAIGALKECNLNLRFYCVEQ